MPTEMELKFSLMDEHVPSAAELEGALAGVGLSLGAAQRTVNEDRYYDDPRMNLSRAGLALRRRMADGTLLATLKTLGSVDGALHVRDELELPIAASADAWNPWPEPIAERLRSITDVRSLRGSFELTIERVRFPLLDGDRLVATACFDDVAARRPGTERSVHWNELEIEGTDELAAEAEGANDGAARAVLNRAAQALGEVLDLVPSSHTKLERARALLMLGATLDE